MVIASGGYPEKYLKGYPIHGLDEAGAVESSHVFHAGTKFDDDFILTAGGRVLGVTGWGTDFHQAQENAYQALECIHFQDMYYRKDIGYRAVQHL